MGTEGKRIRVPHLFNPILTTGCGAGGGMPICIPYSFRSPATSTPLVLLPARRYASAGYRDRNVSVRLFVRPSVRPSRAGIVSKRRKLAS